ncbi:hypothetical protein [Dubosiella newyorkensis]|uniref:Uncharacterized protein n=5 Tax=Dubosiella newyorkensis TaxID=1862672 RepID=A0A1U7NLV9_9FIRM|nr:hypothetical protein [Dubosiella newyorkensis]OLU45991.1 hypothetical protein BO225_07510 [Dubosiella newyorkensis]
MEKFKIKNLFVNIFSIMVCLCMGILLVTPVSASEENIQNRKESNPIILEFNKIQDKITESLSIEGNHYVYDKNYINHLFDEFDINTFNEITGKKYTLESLKSDIYYALDTYIISNQISTYGTYYNRNATEEGWNYWRWYMSEAKTNEMIQSLTNISNGELGTSIILGIISVLPGAGVIGWAGLTATLKAGWNGLYRQSLINVNGPGGTVTDINKFTIYIAFNKPNKVDQ